MKKQRTHAGLTILGFATTLLLVLAVASVALSPIAYAAKPESKPDPKGKANGLIDPLAKGSTVNITATGTAFNITDQTMTKTAKVTLKATVEKSTRGGVKLNVTEGKLTLDGTVYTIEKGKGRVAIHSHKLVIHLVVNGIGGAKLHVVLKGTFTGSLPSSTSTTFTNAVHFTKPQSKLASKFFLDLVGTPTTTSLRRVT